MLIFMMIIIYNSFMMIIIYNGLVIFVFLLVISMYENGFVFFLLRIVVKCYIFIIILFCKNKYRNLDNDFLLSKLVVEIRKRVN